MNLLKKVSGIVLALPLMAACANYDLDSVNDQSVGSWPFAQALHGQYMRLAYDEAAEHDWDDAMFFAGKAQAAADAANEGSTVPDPQMVGDRMIPQDSVIVLNVAYDDLSEALADGRRTKPNAAAQAQTAFDCWLQELEENIQQSHIDLCVDDFEAALELLTASTMEMPMAEEEPMAEEMPMAMAAGPFMVYFGHNSAELDSAAQALITTLAAHKIAADAAGEINIVGHADTSGNAEHNEYLSLARVQAVGTALGDAGVAASVYMSYFGEDMPMMATDDGVRESKNRRVEITLSR